MADARAEYWRGPVDRPLKPAYWEDPLPDWHGMLSSDLIAYYNDAVGGMIGPWDDKLLKPAAYELTLGPMCLVDGEPKRLTEDQPWLEIPYNSIVFVSMAQWVRLPHYIAARFDLAIEFIYQGILLGTGPQVDPGFQGVLSCPLHNISSGSVHMRLGQAFAKMDFAKTSGLRAAAVSTISEERDLYASATASELGGHDGKAVILFKDVKRWREPIFDPGYAGQKRVRSSLKSLEQDVSNSQSEIQEFGNEIRRLRRFGLASAIAAILAISGLLIALAQLDRSYTDSKVDVIRVRTNDNNKVVSELNERLEETRQQLQGVTAKLEGLRSDISDLRGRIDALSKRG